MRITFRPMGSAPEPPPSERILTPERMAGLADRLKEAIAAIEEWGISLDPASRLKETEDLLRDVASAGSFPVSHDGLVEVAHAARDAQEFAEISGMLPEKPLRPVARALKNATQVELSDDEWSEIGGAPYQSQSELWVGAMLSCAADFLGVPHRPGWPDYIVTEGNMKYGVEVKRPRSARRVRRLASKAAKQLQVPIENYHGGALVMDLTDCLGSGMGVTLDPGPPNLHPAQKWIAGQMRKLHRAIYDDSAGRIRIDRSHIFCVTVIARSVHWDLDDLSQMYLHRYIGCLVYSKSAKTLRGHRAAWLAGLIHEGARAAGYHALRGHEIRFQ